MDVRLKDEYMALKDDRLRQHLNIIFNNVFLNFRSSSGPYSDSDYLKAKTYAVNSFETLCTAYEDIYELCAPTLEATHTMSFGEQEEYLNSKWNQWINVFIATYTHTKRASGSWTESDIVQAKKYADASLGFVDVLNELLPPQKTAPLESLGL